MTPSSLGVQSLPLTTYNLEMKIILERIRASLLFIENGKIFQLTPEKRRYFTRGQITSETDIKSTFLKDIYINIGEQIEDNSWTFRLQLNYFIKWIWFSIFLMTFGILMRFFVRAK